MSISNFLKEKIETKEKTSIVELKKHRKPVKIIENRICQICDKTKLIIVYKRNSNKILAHRCEYCGHPIFVKEKVKKVVKKEEIIQSVRDIVFECPVGGVKKCVFEACSFYGNNCKLTKNK